MHAYIHTYIHIMYYPDAGMAVDVDLLDSTHAGGGTLVASTIKSFFHFDMCHHFFAVQAPTPELCKQEVSSPMLRASSSCACTEVMSVSGMLSMTNEESSRIR